MFEAINVLSLIVGGMAFVHYLMLVINSTDGRVKVKIHYVIVAFISLILIFNSFVLPLYVPVKPECVKQEETKPEVTAAKPASITFHRLFFTD